VSRGFAMQDRDDEGTDAFLITKNGTRKADELGLTKRRPQSGTMRRAASA
jgi:hypothetical protein